MFFMAMGALGVLAVSVLVFALGYKRGFTACDKLWMEQRAARAAAEKFFAAKALDSNLKEEAAPQGVRG